MAIQVQVDTRLLLLYKAGLEGVRLFDEGESVWDAYRGRSWPKDMIPEMTDVSGLDVLAGGLQQAKWRPSSRALYNGYFRAWTSFTIVHGCKLMPAEPVWLTRWLVWMALHYAATTVGTAAAAVVAVHVLNGCAHPMQEREIVHLLAGVKAVGIVGSRAPKYIVDSNFVVGMVDLFLEKFPYFRSKWFDPTRKNSDSVMWMRGVALVLVGLELGVRPSSLARLTSCCWKRRLDGSVAVQIDLAKNVKNGKLFEVVLVQAPGSFKDNYSAISFMEEFIFPFMEAQGQVADTSRCVKLQHRTAHCDQCPHLFASWSKAAKVKGRQKAIRPSEVSDMVKKWAVRLDRDPKNYSAVSLRRGSQSIAAARKIDKKIRKKHGGWQSKGNRMPDVYTEVSKSKQKKVGKAIHDTVRRSKANRGKKVRFDFEH